MAWPKGRRRTTKPKDADLKAKLLITMRNREKIWITGEPCTMKALRAALTQKMNAPEKENAVDLEPYSDATVRVEDIDVLQYFPPKSEAATSAPEEPEP